MDVLAELNPAQREAAGATDGPVLILAGPGSGKTRVITHRIAYLIKTCGVSPRRIMAVTFTNKAAREMETRLHRLVGGRLKELTLGTFHAICARILRRDGQAIGVDPKFVIYDDEDQISLIKRATKEIGLDPKQHAPRAISSAISAAKAQIIKPPDYAGQTRSYFEEVVGRVYERYQQILTESSALDFDDLLMKTVLLFRSDADVLDRYQSRYHHIQVDEFQDTNLVQYELVKQIGGKYRNICVVGDPDQSIYSWRFADLRNILSFEKDFPEAKVILLEQNYRSTQKILETADSIIQANRQRKPRELWTENDPGEPPTIMETYTEQEEAQFVVHEIEGLVARKQAVLSDCAVMYRTNAQSRVLEEAFIRYGTPYKLVAGTRFYERREVKDIIAYLRLIQNPADTVSLLRVINVPQRGIGQQTLAKLSAWAQSRGESQYRALHAIKGAGEDADIPFNPRIAKALTGFIGMIDDFIARSRELPPAKLFDLIVKRTGYESYLMQQPGGEERWDNVLELRTLVKQYSDLEPSQGLAAFLEGVALVSDVDGLDESVEAATLITLHQAKGLEFPVVFIVGMEDGVLPHFRSFDDPVQMEEERRLCYVGVTRAKQRVYLVRAFRRSLMGNTVVNKPSRFLADIPRSLLAGADRPLEREGQQSADIPSWDEPQAPTMVVPELKAGCHVRHAAFGEGVVVSYRQADGDAEVVVAFDGAGVKKLLLSFAPLEKVD